MATGYPTLQTGDDVTERYEAVMALETTATARGWRGYTD